MKIAIIGAGFGGLCAAIHLKKEGFDDFAIFERSSDIGGTWRDNTYPGCACDVESHLYSLALAPKSDWSESFSGQKEIWHYMKEVVAKNNLSSHINLNTDIVELRYDEGKCLWDIKDRNGKTYQADFVIAAVGPLNRPAYPSIEGLDTFKGKIMHSAEWDTEYSLADKRVGVVGTGASAIQVVPSIAPIVSKLHVFQRTAAWCVIRGNKKISPFKKWLMTFHPFRWLERERIYWENEIKGNSFLGVKWMHNIANKMAISKLKKEVKDPAIRAKLTPNYAIGCKRILRSDDYWPTFNRVNVELVTEHIQKITETGVILNDGRNIDLDCLALCTGFVAADFYLYTKIYGKGNTELVESWEKTGAVAYKGICTSGFPNFSFILGPNTGLGHNSVLHMMESQMCYIVQMLKSGKKELDVKPEVQQRYNEKMQAMFAGTVWESGCKSWYKNKDGKNTTLYPRLTKHYRHITKTFEAKDYM